MLQLSQVYSCKAEGLTAVYTSTDYNRRCITVTVSHSTVQFDSTLVYTTIHFVILILHQVKLNLTTLANIEWVEQKSNINGREESKCLKLSELLASVIGL